MNPIVIQHSAESIKAKVPEKNFSGDVFISDFIERPLPSNVVSARVVFSPGARTPWKLNELGQTLIVISGKGWAQCQGTDITAIEEGDIVWCPPGIWHWDGAAIEHPMTYIAVYEGNDGKIVQFGEKVSDKEFSEALKSYDSFQNDQ